MTGSYIETPAILSHFYELLKHTVMLPVHILSQTYSPSLGAAYSPVWPVKEIQPYGALGTKACVCKR